MMNFNVKINGASYVIISKEYGKAAWVLETLKYL